MSVRLGIPEVDYRNSLDDGSFIIADANAKIRYYLAGTTTPTEVWADKDLTISLGSSVSILASGWPEYVNVWGADDVSYKATITRTGYNGGVAKEFDYIAVATATGATGESTPAFTNSIANGDFTQWSGPTTFSNISGSAAAVEIADGFYFSQNNAAANAISRQAADSEGARYGLRFGRPNGSSSTEQLRVYFTLPTEEAIRYRGKTGTLSIAIKKGANFSGTALGILGVTGTGVGEDGNSINGGSWTGQASFISKSQTINTDIARFQYSGTIGENISEIGFQLAYTPTGTAGANDWVQVEDIQFQDAASAGDFEALPTPITKLLTRNFDVKGADLASAATVLLYKATGDFVDITGTTTITSFGEAESGFSIDVRFAGSLTLTHNGTSLILPGNGANIKTAAGDTARFRSLGGGNWLCEWYQTAGGLRVVVRTYSANDTYTPTAGMLFCIIECVGGGGGGGGTANSGAGTIGSGGGGGGGSYSRKRATAAEVGTSLVVTVAAAANGGAAGNNNGTAGNDTSVGALCIAKGGSAGQGSASGGAGTGGAGGIAGTGDVLLIGEAGTRGMSASIVTTTLQSGKGGNSGGGYGPGGAPRVGQGDGNNGNGAGGGGSGGYSVAAGGAAAGGSGQSGFVVITEYCA